MLLESAKSKYPMLTVKLFLNISNLCDRDSAIPQRHGQTDRQTGDLTYSNAALCVALRGKNSSKFTSVGCLQPRSHKSDPVCLVCTGITQPVNQLTVPPRTSSVSENSQRSTTRQTVVTCTEPRQ